MVPPFNSMSSHESRLVIRRGPDVAPSHQPCVALSVVLTFTTKSGTHLNLTLYIYIYINGDTNIKFTLFKTTIKDHICYVILKEGRERPVNTTRFMSKPSSTSCDVIFSFYEICV